jgi:hypothetical protein
VAVMCGLDTDCNGASVGSIVGAASGLARFKDDLAGRLHDTIKPQMIGFHTTRRRAAKRHCCSRPMGPDGTDRVRNTGWVQCGLRRGS